MDVRQAIIDHYNKKGAIPNYNSVGGYAASHETFKAMIANGEIVHVIKLSATGRKMKRMELVGSLKKGGV